MTLTIIAIVVGIAITSIHIFVGLGPNSKTVDYNCCYGNASALLDWGGRFQLKASSLFFFPLP